MKPGLWFTIAAIYLVLVGLGYLLVPDAMVFGTLGNAAPAVVASLRALGGSLIAVGILNWLVRSAEASKPRDAVMLSNTIGFGLAAISLALGQVGGAPATGWVPTIISALICVAFLVVGPANMSTRAS